MSTATATKREVIYYPALRGVEYYAKGNFRVKTGAPCWGVYYGQLHTQLIFDTWGEADAEACHLAAQELKDAATFAPSTGIPHYIPRFQQIAGRVE